MFSVRKKSKNAIITLACLLWFSIASLNLLYNSSDVQPVSEQNNQADEKAITNSIIDKRKTILLMDRLWQYEFGTGKTPFIDAGCPVSNCYITMQKETVPEKVFDAFVFHPPSQGDPVEIPCRRSNQLVVLFSTEPPTHMPRLTHFEDYFNYTMTYMSDSDFPVPYGRIEPLPNAPKHWRDIKAKMKETAKLANPAKEKSKLVLWMVTNCYANSNRQDYVKVLQKYIQVDIVSVGNRCGGTVECARSTNDVSCYDMLEKDYKFYLSFENAICKDYVTEKFFNIISRNVVPVVLGGANYEGVAPPHSFINALEYTPKQLAEYLVKLNENDHLYAEYFWWKPFYRVLTAKQVQNKAFCDLCATLHNLPGRPKTVSNLQMWYHDGEPCLRNPIYADDNSSALVEHAS